MPVAGRVRDRCCQSDEPEGSASGVFGRNGLEKPENKLDRLVARLKEDAVKAEKAGVILGLEGRLPPSVTGRFVDRVGSPAVKVYFDCVHAHQEGADISKEIALLGDSICEFHAKDYGDILSGRGRSTIGRCGTEWMPSVIGLDSGGAVGEVTGDKPLGFEETHRRNLQYLRRVFPLNS